MTALVNTKNMTALIAARNEEAECFYLVHPLDDCPEVKRSADHLGPMPMTASVKWSLITLQGYLVLMLGLVAYNTLHLAGFVGH